MKKHVVVQSYDKTWSYDFVVIRDELNTVLKDLALRIEHVGSTSVEGLSAKPIIDIDVVIQDRTDLPEVIAALQKLGYSHEGDQGIPGREAFKYEGKEHLRKHHLYVCALDAKELKRHPNPVMAYMMLFSTGKKRLDEARGIVIKKFCEPYCWENRHLGS